jgi:hypothetical protein
LAGIVVAETAFILLAPALAFKYGEAQRSARDDAMREMLLEDFKHVQGHRVVHDYVRLEGEDGVLSIEGARGITLQRDLRQVILKQRNNEPLSQDIVDVLEEGGFRVESTKEPNGETKIKVERFLRSIDDAGL